MSPEQLPVDELREKLKDLGYLRTGVDRFVLAPARQERSPARIALGAGARVGLLAGALLGPAAAIGIAARLPQLVTGTRDAIVVAIYLALLFTLAGAAITLATAFLARGAVRLSGKSGARVARLAPAVAGGAVTAACLAYLALWWGAINPGPAWSAPVWTSLALAAAVSISLVIGHAVAVTVGALLARDSPALLVKPSTGRRRIAFALRVVAFAAAAALLVATVRPADTSELTPAFAVIPTGQRVIVIGIDGFDPALVGLSDLLPDPTKPTAIASVPSAADSDPARVWTTIATGMPPASHGITALELRRVAGLEGAVAPEGSPTARAITATTGLLRLGRPAIASGTQRKLKTFWEVAAEKGLSTAVVNWWATWPASGPSTVLSDRALLRLERTGPLDAEIWPPQLYDRLRSEWPRLSEEARRLAEKAFEGIEPAALRSVLIRSATFDAIVVLLAMHPAIEANDLLALYLPGLDIAQHSLATAESTPTGSALAARTTGIRTYYAFLSRLTRQIAGGVERDRALFIVIAHPGRVSSASVGGIALNGSIASASSGQTAAAFVDVAPTILFALGLPSAADLSGAPLTTMFGEQFARRHPVRVVETYGRRAAERAVRGGQPLDQEMLDRLRSLGYVR
jgi:hypothetical protein